MNNAKSSTRDAPTHRFCSQKFTSHDNCVRAVLLSPLKQLGRVHSAIVMTSKDASASITCADTKNRYIHSTIEVGRIQHPFMHLFQRSISSAPWHKEAKLPCSDKMKRKHAGVLDN